MTPLAQFICRSYLEGTVKRARADVPTHADALMSSDCHCFELSEVMPLVSDLAHNPKWLIRDDQRFFLPSPRTWLEWRASNGRNGAMLEAWEPTDFEGKDAPRVIVVNLLALNKDEGLLELEHGEMMIYRSADGRIRISVGDRRDDEAVENEWKRRTARELCSMLSLINTPRIIGRRQHMPHAGLQRQIAKNKGMAGKFPLLAWTEIKLEVTPPIYDPHEHETRLSAGKALHFCRAHLRVRLGQVELVSAHWRGDPALGIKQQRYAVVPPRPGARRTALGEPRVAGMAGSKVGQHSEADPEKPKNING